jgi:1-acyl-sn-glycerol-3-phosphate acyltransferase
MLRAILVVSLIFSLIFFFLPFVILVARLQAKPDVLYSVGRLGIRLGFRLAGIKLEIQGLERIDFTRSYLFLANHEGLCDPPALVLAIPQDIKFILKKELDRVPILNWAMKYARFVFIDRRDRIQSVRSMNQAVKQMQQGASFLVFPEGTRTRTGKMGEFKRGPFVMAIQAGVPIIPVRVSGSFQVMPPTQFRINPGTIVLQFFPPVETAGLSTNEREALKNRVWKIIAGEQTILEERSI